VKNYFFALNFLRSISLSVPVPLHPKPMEKDGRVLARMEEDRNHNSFLSFLSPEEKCIIKTQ
jgi:hypothetical protein